MDLRTNFRNPFKRKVGATQLSVLPHFSWHPLYKICTQRGHEHHKITWNWLMKYSDLWIQPCVLWNEISEPQAMALSCHILYYWKFWTQSSCKDRCAAEKVWYTWIHQWLWIHKLVIDVELKRTKEAATRHQQYRSPGESININIHWGIPGITSTEF